MRRRVRARGETPCADSLRAAGELLAFVARSEHADPPHPPALLCLRRERPRRRAAEERDEFAPSKASAHTTPLLPWVAPGRIARPEGTFRKPLARYFVPVGPATRSWGS